MLRRCIPILALTSATFASFGCSKQGSVSLTESQSSYSAGDYEGFLDKWTRETKLITVDEMDNVLTVTSTYQSRDFRRAYTERYARDYRLTGSDKDAFLSRSLAEADEFHQFYVALYAQHPRWGDLTTEEPAWVVRLVDSTGSETEPAEIVQVRKPSAMERTYFPYIGSHRTVYRLSFPTRGGSGSTIDERAEWFGLRFTGAQGGKAVMWQLSR